MLLLPQVVQSLLRNLAVLSALEQLFFLRGQNLQLLAVERPLLPAIVERGSSCLLLLL